MLIIPAFLARYRSLADKSLQLTLETNEPTPEQVMALQNALMKPGFVAFKDNPFADEEKALLDGLKAQYNETGKSKSQLLYNVLYRRYEQFPQGYNSFIDYYNAEMDKLINHHKSQLL